MQAFNDKIVVITGAASGIGRATTLRFAKRGAKVVLIDLNQQGLNTLLKEVQEQGPEGFSLTIDVSDFDALKKGVEDIVSRFGKIDIWINNAGIAVYGEFQQIPPEEFRRVMDVNFFGHINGVYAAMPYLEKSESMGVMLATISVLGEATAPLQTPYTSSKFALSGFYGSLHEELTHRKSRMKIGTILPASVATPFFSHAKTYLGVEPRPFPPAFSAELIAEKFERAALNPKLGMVGGSIGGLYIKLYRYLEKLFHPVQAQAGYLFQRSHYPKGPEDANNLNTGIEEQGLQMDKRWRHIPYSASKMSSAWRSGLVGVGLMDLLVNFPAYYFFESRRTVRKEKAVHIYGRWAPEAAATLIASKFFSVKLNDKQSLVFGRLFHFALGASFAKLYQPLLRHSVFLRKSAGLPLGALLFAFDELATYYLGFAAKPARYPLPAHLRGLASNFVLGFTIHHLLQKRP